MLLVNDILKYVEVENKTIRILWISSDGENMVTYEIGKKNALPELVKVKVITEELTHGMCKLVDDQFLNVSNPQSISEKALAKRDHCWEIISDIIIKVPDIFSRTKRHRLITEASLKHNVSYVNIYRYLRKYWAKGQTKNTLLPDYSKSGGKGKIRASNPLIKRGRPTKYGDYVGINVDESIREIFRSAVIRQYASESRFTIAAAYSHMITDYFNETVVDDSGKEIHVLKDEYRDKGAPTYTQFYYWLKKVSNEFEIKRKRLGNVIYDKDMRGLLGTSNSQVWGPGARYQIDATLADVYLLSSISKSKIIGRPVLYVVIDVFSRMIAGIYVGIEGPSWVTAMMALANTAADKVEFCKAYGITIQPEDWPCKSLPAILLGDKGEIASHYIESLSSNFNVKIENAASYRADWKGIVEKQFHLLPAKFKPYAPGYVQPTKRARGERDYRLDAKLTLEEFTKIIIISVLNYNNNQELVKYDLSSGLVQDSVQPIPIDLWEWGIKNVSGSLRSYPEEAVMFSLLPTHQATVTEYGIKVFNLYYFCSEIIADKWLDRARQSGTWKVTISYDPRHADVIYLHVPDAPLGFIRCNLTDRSRAYRSGSIWEAGQSFEDAKHVSANSRRNRIEANADLNKSIRNIVDGAIERADEQDSSSDRSKVRNIRANRAVERRENRKSEAFNLGYTGSSNKADVLNFPIQKKADYDSPDITEMISGFEDEDDE